MEREGGEIVSTHHLTVPIVSDSWCKSVLNLNPYPISRGRWFVKPLFITHIPISEEVTQQQLAEEALERLKNPQTVVPQASEEDRPAPNTLVRLVCRQALCSDERELRYLACFNSNELKDGTVIFSADLAPIKDCEDKLIFFYSALIETGSSDSFLRPLQRLIREPSLALS